MTITTSDGKQMREGDRAFSHYTGKWGTIGTMQTPGGWFSFRQDDGTVELLNGERIASEDRTQPGVYENQDGTVTMKWKSDREQLEMIADAVIRHVSSGMPTNDAHRLRGYAEQLRLIADRMPAKPAELPFVVVELLPVDQREPVERPDWAPADAEYGCVSTKTGKVGAVYRLTDSAPGYEWSGIDGGWEKGLESSWAKRSSDPQVRPLKPAAAPAPEPREARLDTHESDER